MDGTKTSMRIASWAWEDLVAGQFVVASCRDARGRRHLALRPIAAPLTESQRLVLSYRAYGWGFAEIGAELGVSAASVHVTLNAVVERMGLRSELDIPMIFGAALRSTGRRGSIERAPPPELVRRWVRTDPMPPPAGLTAERRNEQLVLSYPVCEAPWRGWLSSSESEIVEAVAAGLHHAEIARRRGTGRATVSNQIHSALCKLGLRSKLDLALLVFAGRRRRSAEREHARMRPGFGGARGGLRANALGLGRGSGTKSPGRAASRTWKNLVAGRFAVATCRDARGFRHLALYKTMTPLTESQYLVFSYRAYDWSFGEIAAELGISLASVHNALHAAIETLGLRSELDIPLVFGAALRSAGRSGSSERLPPAELVRRWVRTNPLPPPAGLTIRRRKKQLLLSYPVREARWRDPLTPAEVEVVEALVSGLGPASVARRRGTAERTVWNQVQSILGKLDLCSRLDLALLVLAGRRRGTRAR